MPHRNAVKFDFLWLAMCDMSLATIKELVMATSLVHSDVELSDDVTQLANKLGVAAYLPQVLGMTRLVFPDARLEVATEEDPEIAGEVCLAIIVRNSLEDAHELFQVSSGWHRRLYDCCPPHLASAFRLNTDWRP